MKALIFFNSWNVSTNNYELLFKIDEQIIIPNIGEQVNYKSEYYKIVTKTISYLDVNDTHIISVSLFMDKI